MDLTVGIVVYNTPIQTFLSTLESICAQIDPGKIVVLCNSENESYRAGMRKLISRFHGVFLLFSENKGFGAGHNKIVSGIESQFYLCANPDIALLPGSLKKIFETAEKIQEFGAIGPKILNQGKLSHLCRPYLNLWNWLARQVLQFGKLRQLLPEYQFNYQVSGPNQFVSGCCFLVRRETFLGVGGFDESFFLYCEDADLMLRLGRVSPNWYCAEAEVEHEWQRAWRGSTHSKLRHLRALAKYFLKHPRVALTGSLFEGSRNGSS